MREEEGLRIAQDRIARAKWSKGKEVLDLSRLGLTEIPGEVVELPFLEQLDLSGNAIVTIPGFLGELRSLLLLDLSDNEIADIPDSIQTLPSLTDLFLSDNQIQAVPDWFTGPSHLGSLYLDGNQITGLPESFGKLINLTHLDLSENRITELPGSIVDLHKLRSFNLTGNPLPDEVLAAHNAGPESLFRYLRAARKFKPRTVKLVLLGEPKAGKTTLLEALKGNPQPCDPSRVETIGVDVVNLPKASPTDGETMTLSVWDFAGQHMEHATHQFFLTDNAVYLILWNARQGHESGKRDLWYWLELLKMRVREPKFLLVATHTELTPPDLNLADIEREYPGYQGHCAVELDSLKGFAALEQRVLTLAAQSPSMRAEWPGDWLPVRDEVRRMRADHPYITPLEFQRLVSRHGIKDEVVQHDLGDQLHYLGEILYFQEREALANLVILDPEWVTELIALVVRSAGVRAHNGMLRKKDLDQLWQKAQLPPKVRRYLINLMDWFDLTYSTGHPSDIGIVVEALPYSKPEDREQVELPPGHPQMEMIFRFPSLQRRLPPGIPTWGIARAHRFRKGEPWRDLAAFEDTDTGSLALITASDTAKEIRLRVVADYPPFFFGRMEAILRDTFKRYPGAEPERRVPCPCRPGCSFSYRWETVLKRAQEGKPNVTCDISGDDVSVQSLVTGFRVETPAAELAFRAERRRLFTAMREQMDKTCPSVFTLVPAKDFKLLETWMESKTRREELELALYCEHDSGWHQTAHSIYRFTPDQQWFDDLKKGWNGFVAVTKHVAVLAKVSAKVGPHPHLEALGLVGEKLPEAARSPAGKIAGALGGRTELNVVELETRHLLQKLIEHLDSKRTITEAKNGGLHRQLIDDGRLLWLCPDHHKMYQGRG